MSTGDTRPIRQLTPPALPAARPEDLGFDPARLARAMRVLESGLQQGAYPGAVALVARHGKVAASMAIGQAEIAPTPRAMTLQTIFDLASVTKVVAGVSAVLVLLDAGLIALDDPVARFLPAFAAGGKSLITVQQLLTHTSGLPPWLPCYLRARTSSETFDYLCTVDLEAGPGTQVVYSDVGMSLVRAIVRAVTGEDLPALLEREVFTPLSLRETGYLPENALRERIAATELGNRHEEQMLARAGLQFDDWRNRLLVGEVHDGNAYYALEGISSHAGLFSTASDLLCFGQLYLQRGRWQDRQIFSEAAIAAALRPRTAGLQDSFGLGWRLVDSRASSTTPPARSALTRAFFPEDTETPARAWAGDLLPPGSFGHTGFTGTSIVICPPLDLVLVLLTNRVHPDAARIGVARVRGLWHNAVVAAAVE